MTRFLLIGDIHLSDRPPSSCTETYNDDILDLLRQTAEIDVLQNAGAVVWAGDVFHNKTPSRTSHRLVQKAIDLVKAYRAPLYVVPGNHDMLNDRFDSLFDTQPLGVLYEAGANLLDGWAQIGDGYELFGFPWLQEWSEEIVMEKLKPFREYGTPESLVVAHAPLYPPGLELTYEFFPADVFARAMGNKGSCYYGHVHEAHGFYTVDGVNFCNVGAITRGSLHEHDLSRVVSVAAWDRVQGFTIIPLQYKPSDEVFRLVEHAEVQAAEQRLGAFLDAIGSTTLEVTSVEAVMASVREKDLSEELVALIQSLLTEAPLV